MKTIFFALFILFLVNGCNSIKKETGNETTIQPGIEMPKYDSPRYQPIVLGEKEIAGDSVSLLNALSGYDASGGLSQEISILLKPWNYAKGYDFLLLGPISQEDMVRYELSIRQLINSKKGVVDEIDFLKELPNKQFEKMKLLVIKR